MITDLAEQWRPARRLVRSPAILRLLLASVLLGLSVIMSTPSIASAHAVLVDSSPRDGVRLEHAPDQVQLQFDEPVQAVPDAARVINSAGDRVDADPTRSADAGRTVIIGLRELTDRPDSYLVSWQVTSADGHLVSGSLRFGVKQAPDVSSAPDQNAQDRPLAAVATAANAVTYAGLVAAVGCLAVVLVIWPAARRSPRLPALIIAGTAAVGIGSVIELIIEGVTRTGADLSAVQLPNALGQGISTLSGQLLLARVIIASVLAPMSLLLLNRSARQQWATVWSLIASLLLIITAAHGHALVAPHRAVSILATAAHLAGMCCWIGGMIVLIMVVAPRIRAVPPALGRAVAPWSRFAFGCVAVLIISGELLAWQQVQPFEALWNTRYGVTLLIKLGLVVVAAMLGRLTSRLLQRSRSRRPARAVLSAEIAVGAMIIVAASLLSATPAATDTYGPPETAVADFDHGQLIVEIDSTHRGPQQITVRPRTYAGDPIELKQLTGRLSSADAGVGALDVRFARSGEDWHSTDATAPLPGSWTLQLTARPASGPAYATSVEYRVW